MRTSLLLGAVAVGQVAAINHKHASFHARRSAQPVDYDLTKVDWHKALKDVDWSKVNYGGSGKPSTPETTAPAETTAPETTAAPSSAEDSYDVHEPSSDEADATSQAPPKKTSTPSTGNVDVDFSLDVASLGAGSKFGHGVNSKTNNGKLWIGTDSDYLMTFTNDASVTGGVLCTSSDKMFNVGQQGGLIFVKLEPGKSVTLAAADGFSGSCAPIYDNSECSKVSGIIDDSLFEFTAGKSELGVFDISRIVSMQGTVITAVGKAGCTSGVKDGQLACIFGCDSNRSTCGEKGTYNLLKGAEKSNLCQTGDRYGAPEGGCRASSDGDHIQISLTDSTAWPSSVFKAYKGEYAVAH